MYLVEARARCIDCGWETEARNAMGTAARHHKKTGHYVQVELGFAQLFGKPKDEANTAILNHASPLKIEEAKCLTSL